MNIRSITGFLDYRYPLDVEQIREMGSAIDAVRSALEREGFAVQTTRLATQPFPLILSATSPDQAIAFAQELERVAQASGITYVSVGPVRLGDPPDFAETIVTILKNTGSVFAGIEIARAGVGLSLPVLRLAARIIREIAFLQDDGFVNLRLAALANVAPWSPFFPAAYHGGGPACIALAIEGASLAVDAVHKAGSLAKARQELLGAVEATTGRLDTVARQSLQAFEVLFQGIDFSLAPYPEYARSIGHALESLGLSSVGEPGSLMAVALLTDALDQARFARTGFCSLFMPVLEDTILAKRGAEGRLHITDLLAYSAVCGAGLDTIPLPGDVTQDTLTGILGDVAALALRLNKPLTARLMPLPGKQAGDSTAFDFEFFANSKVFDVRGRGLTGLLGSDEILDLQPRPVRLAE